MNSPGWANGSLGTYSDVRWEDCAHRRTYIDIQRSKLAPDTHHLAQQQRRQIRALGRKLVLHRVSAEFPYRRSTHHHDIHHHLCSARLIQFPVVHPPCVFIFISPFLDTRDASFPNSKRQHGRITEQAIMRLRRVGSVAVQAVDV